MKYDFVFDTIPQKVRRVEIEYDYQTFEEIEAHPDFDGILKFDEKVFVNLGCFDFVIEAGEPVTYTEPSGCPIMTFDFADDDTAFNFSQAFNDMELEPWRIHLVRNLDTGKEYAAY